MLVNARKTKAMVVSRSLTVLPCFPPLFLDGRVLVCEEMLRILGVNVDCKLTFESHLRAVAASVAQKLGIMHRAWSVFKDVEMFLELSFASLGGLFSCLGIGCRVSFGLVGLCHS